MGKPVFAVLVATGILATLTGSLTQRYEGKAIDIIKDVAGDPAIKIYRPPDDELHPDPSQLWALSSTIKAEVGTGVPDEPAISKLLTDRKPVSARSSTYRVVLESNRLETILITSIRARELKRDSALATTLVMVDKGGGPVGAPVELQFDLDSVDKTALTKTGEPFLDVNGLTLEPGEKLRFTLIGTTKTSYVEWNVEVGFLVNRRARSILVAPTNSPFRSTAVSKSYAEIYTWTTTGGLQPAAAAICQGDCRSIAS